MTNTKIEWADHTFNPWRGCAKVSPACQNCYAEVLSRRNPAMLGIWGQHGTRVLAGNDSWRKVKQWDADAKSKGIKYKVFCASFADVFEDWQGPVVSHKGEQMHVPVHSHQLGSKWIPESDCNSGEPPLTMAHVRQALFDLIDETPNLIWLLLTKRPHNILRLMPGTGWLDAETQAIPVRNNVWFGTTVENQATANERIPELLKVPARLRFLSCEPLLEEVKIADVSGWGNAGKWWGGTVLGPAGIGWVITGGESGSEARPMHPEWAFSLRDQCRDANVPFFFKQWGEWYPAPDHFIESIKAKPQPKIPLALAGQPISLRHNGYDVRKVGEQHMMRIGKNMAGRLLYNKEYNEFPEVEHVANDC